MQKHYVNLTNGIDFLPILGETPGITDVCYIRIQSTACEQKRWDFILQDLDNDFLLNLAAGNECVIYDCGSRKNEPRALYQGVPWIIYALYMRWFGAETKPFVKKTDCAQYFNSCYKGLTKRTKKKLDYFKPFLNTDVLRVKTVTISTENDGRKDIYNNILKKYQKDRR